MPTTTPAKVQKQHSILLIEPPFYRLYNPKYSLDKYPLSLGYLAGTIRKETGWNVTAYNADFCPESEPMTIKFLTTSGFDNYLRALSNLSNPVWLEVKSTIARYDPELVGITSKSQNFRSASVVAKLTKEINKDTIVAIGGPHPSMVGSEVFKDPSFDVTVRGEGERTIVDILNHIDQSDTLRGVKGIHYKDGDRIVETPPREFIQDLDSLCYPSEHAPFVLKDYDRYKKSCFGYIFATRGCPYSCFFCGSRYIWGKSVRFRSVGNVTNEMKILQENGTTSVLFDDDTFGVNKGYITSLCKSIMEKTPGMKWGCELHVNLVDDATIRTMKEAGCSAVYMGVESGNNEILRKTRKGFTIEKAISACQTVRKHGIQLYTFFIVGFPWETEGTLRDTFAAMQRLPPEVQIVYSIFTPYPNTEAFELCKRYGLVGENFNLALYNHQSPENCFTMNISKNRFRQLVTSIEDYVDTRNSRAPPMGGFASIQDTN